MSANSTVSTYQGLEVVVSAINAETNVEYELYVKAQYNDCARTTFVTNKDGTKKYNYLAKFDNLMFPARRDDPPRKAQGLQPYSADQTTLAPVRGLAPHLCDCVC